MIAKLTGKLIAISDEEILVELNSISYEVLIPIYLKGQLAERIGDNITLYTIEYLEGSAIGGTLFPKLIGFTDPTDREFFLQFVKVKGFGFRKALRAFTRPAYEIASAIEAENKKFLSSLPEIGRRTADQLIAALKGKLLQFTTSGATTPELAEDRLSTAEKEALEALIQLGEKRTEAIELIKQTTSKFADIKNDPAKIIEMVYKQKAGKS